MWMLKRGVGEGANWKSLEPSYASEIRKAEYGAMDQELDRAVPENKELNQRYSNLKTVIRGARQGELSAGIGERLIDRMKRPTGGLASILGTGLIGAGEGGKLGGVPGAIAGGAAGALAPIVLSSPTVDMAIARGLWKMGGGERLPAPEVRPGSGAICALSLPR